MDIYIYIVWTVIPQKLTNATSYLYMESKKAPAFDSVQGLRLTVMSFTFEEKWGLI